MSPGATNPTAFLQQSLDRLVSDPEGFLKRHHLQIAGAGSGPVTYYMSEVERGGMRASAFDMRNFGGAGSLAFPAICVPMLQSTAVDFSSLSGVLLPMGGPAKLMVTGQLSGCSFVVSDTPSGLLTTHIQPRGMDGHVLQRKLTNEAGFAGGAEGPSRKTIVFGRDFYPMYATVVGVCAGGAWEVWAQLHDGPGRNVTGVAKVS